MKWNYHYPVSAEIVDVRITEEHHHIFLTRQSRAEAKKGATELGLQQKGCAGARGTKTNILLYLSKRSTHQAKFVCPVKPGLVDYCSHNPMVGSLPVSTRNGRGTPQLKWGRQEIASALFLAQALVPTGDYLPVLCWLVNDKQLRAFLP